MTQNLHPLPGLGTVKTVYRDSKLIVHLPGLAKNAAPRPRTATQLNRRAVSLHGRQTLTKTIADLVFATPPRLFYHDQKVLVLQDNFILTS